jgi:hypothetical protein
MQIQSGFSPIVNDKVVVKISKAGVVLADDGKTSNVVQSKSSANKILFHPTL